MFSHVDREHGPFPLVFCEHCDKTFDCQTELNLHMKRDHLKEVEVPCPDCGKLQTTGYMKTHYELVHKICEPITCETCDKKFIDPYIMFNHVDREHGPFPLDFWEQCDKTFDCQ